MDKDLFKKIVDSQQSGHSIIDVRTGFAKTYNAVVYMAEAEHTLDKRFIFVTNKKNNLPYDTFCTQYQKMGKSIEDEVLVVESYFDAIIHRFPKVKVPTKFQNEIYIQLKFAIENYLSATKDGEKTNYYRKENAEMKIKGNPNDPDNYGLEKKFRLYVKDLLTSQFKGKKYSFQELKKQKQKLVKEDSDFTWIKALYPEMMIYDYKVLLMTTNKFISSYDTIIGGSESFLLSNLIEGAIIIFDEFDQTKKVILNEIIERTLKSNANYLNLFAGFHRVFFRASPSTLIQDARSDELKEQFQGIKEKYLVLSEKFLPDYNWKLEQEEGQRNLIYFNGTYTNYLDKNADNRLYCHYVEEKNEVEMEILSKAAFEEKGEDSVKILELLYDLNGFFKELRVYFIRLAERLQQQRNDPQNGPHISMSKEDAYLSVLNSYKLNMEEKELLSADFLQLSGKTKLNKRRKIHNQFYENGLLLLSFTNRTNDIANTQMEFFKIAETPEKIILYLADKAHVVGLSATAGLETNLANYDLRFFKRFLGKQFQLASDTYALEMKQQYEGMEGLYQKYQVPISVNTFKTLRDAMRTYDFQSVKDVQDILNAVFDFKKGLKQTKIIQDFAERLSSFCLEESDMKEFLLRRYLELFCTFQDFIRDQEMESFLGLMMKAPVSGDSKLEKDLLQEVFSFLSKQHEVEATLRILVGEGFERGKKTVIEELKNGKKVYVLSTYQTMGDGQNLQYEPNDPTGLIQIVEEAEVQLDDPRITQKDFDSLYLGEITYVTQNIYGDHFDLKTLLYYLVEIEYIAKAEELTPEEQKTVTKDGLQRYVSKQIDHWDQKNRQKLKETLSGRRKILQQVMQAVGRLTRTFMKRKISLYVDYHLLVSLPIEDMEKLKEKYLLADEMKLILDEAEKVKRNAVKASKQAIQGAIRTDDFYHYRNRVLRTINRDNRHNLNNSEYGIWTDGQQFYEEIRETVLRYPTISSQSDLVSFDSLFENFYIPIHEEPRYVTKFDPESQEYKFEFEQRIDALYRIAEWHHAFEVSFETSILPVVFKYPDFKIYYQQLGYAMNFEKQDLMMNPSMFKFFFNPAISELAGKYILEKELNVKIERYLENGYFEYFDYQLIPLGQEKETQKKILIDFKYWSTGYDEKAKTVLDEIYQKLNETSADLVFVINLVAESDAWEITRYANDRVIVIPGLIDKEGTLLKKYVREVDEAIGR